MVHAARINQTYSTFIWRPSTFEECVLCFGKLYCSSWMWRSVAKTSSCNGQVSVLFFWTCVILQFSRYWHSTSAYAIAQAAHDFPDKVEIPPEGDSFYQWPEDLLKPDIVLFLDVSEDVRNQRLARRKLSTSQEGLLKQSLQFRQKYVLYWCNTGYLIFWVLV